MANSLETLTKQLEELDAKHAEDRQKLVDKIDTIKLQEFEKLKEQAALLGFKLTDKDSKKRQRKEKPPEERHCDICNRNGHDKRLHRTQKEKKPFTTAELKERGLA